MNYDEYIEEVKKFSSDADAARLVLHLDNWKSDSTTVVELAGSMERFFGNSWISHKETHNHLYKLWTAFKIQAISAVDGMTMNERLYWFGLIERFDACSAEEQQRLYTKLCANP